MFFVCSVKKNKGEVMGVDSIRPGNESGPPVVPYAIQIEELEAKTVRLVRRWDYKMKDAKSYEKFGRLIINLFHIFAQSMVNLDKKGINVGTFVNQLADIGKKIRDPSNMENIDKIINLCVELEKQEKKYIADLATLKELKKAEIDLRIFLIENKQQQEATLKDKTKAVEESLQAINLISEENRYREEIERLADIDIQPSETGTPHKERLAKKNRQKAHLAFVSGSKAKDDIGVGAKKDSPSPSKPRAKEVGDETKPFNVENYHQEQSLARRLLNLIQTLPEPFVRAPDAEAEAETPATPVSDDEPLVESPVQDPVQHPNEPQVQPPAMAHMVEPVVVHQAAAIDDEIEVEQPIERELFRVGDMKAKAIVSFKQAIAAAYRDEQGGSPSKTRRSKQASLSAEDNRFFENVTKFKYMRFYNELLLKDIDKAIPLFEALIEKDGKKSLKPYLEELKEVKEDFEQVHQELRQIIEDLFGEVCDKVRGHLPMFEVILLSNNLEQDKFRKAVQAGIDSIDKTLVGMSSVDSKVIKSDLDYLEELLDEL